MARPQRIAFFFATSGHSGVDRIARNLLPALVRRGYAVDLITIRDHGPYLEEEEKKGVRCMELGVKHVHSSFPHIVRYLRRHEPDALFCDKDRVNRTVLLAKRLARVSTRVVVSVGTTVSVNLRDRGWLERRLQLASMRYLYPSAHSIVVTSEGVADDMTALTGLPRQKISPTPCPVFSQAHIDSARQPVDHPWFAKGQPPVILGIGELGGRKDFATLLRAFARFRKQRECRLVILGRGKRRETLLKLAAQLGISDDFDLPGFQPNPYAFLAQAAVFAHSSRLEGLGFVIIEALALGVPVVATDCPSGPREILQGGRVGQLVPVGDDAKMAAALGDALDAPVRVAELQRAAAPYEVEAATTGYLRAMGLPA